MRRLSLGLDVGTQSTKAIVLDADSGGIVGRGARPLAMIPGLPPGAAEQDPDEWFAAAAGAAREALAAARAEPREIGAVSVSGQQHGLVALDASGRPVRPAKLWCDVSTAAEASEIAERTGRPLPAGYTASKILWMARHEPANHARIAAILLPHDWINFRLTGRKTMECGDASGTGFFDPEGGRFDPVLAGAVDSRLMEWLPPLVGPDDMAGRLTAEAARAFGLEEGLPVAPGSGDNMMSAIGSGAARFGVLVLSLGTSGTAFVRSISFLRDASGIVAPFCDALGAYLPLLCVMNMTGVTEDLARFFGAARAREDLTDLAGRIPAGCDGLVYLPYLAGERVPELPGATGVLSGIRPGLLEHGRLFRAAIEGTSIGLVRGLDRFRALGGSWREVRLVGGGARNPLWRRTLATLLRESVYLPAEADSAALGAAIQAAALAGRIAGRSESVAAIADRAVRLEGPPVDPVPEWEGGLAAARAEFQGLLARLHGIGDGGPPAGSGAGSGAGP